LVAAESSTASETSRVANRRSKCFVAEYEIEVVLVVRTLRIRGIGSIIVRVTASAWAQPGAVDRLRVEELLWGEGSANRLLKFHKERLALLVNATEEFRTETV
jgi:hypothetical protein